MGLVALCCGGVKFWGWCGLLGGDEMRDGVCFGGRLVVVVAVVGGGSAPLRLVVPRNGISRLFPV